MSLQLDSSGLGEKASKYKILSPFYLILAFIVLLIFFLFSFKISKYDASNSVIIQTDTTSNKVEVHIVIENELLSPLLTHYTEHLVWLNAIARERAANRHSNAWTSKVAVGYWLSGSPDEVADVLKTLSGVFDPINLPSVFADEERDILLREYEYRMIGKPDAQAERAMDAFLYSGNAFATSPIGTPEEIKALDYEAARNLHAKTHVPENTRLLVIGNVSEDKVWDAIQESGWPATDSIEPEIAPPPFDLAAPGMTTLRYPEVSVSPRLIWRRVVKLPNPIQFDLLEAQTALLRDILNSNLPGGLAGPLRYDAAITRNFNVKIWPIDEDIIEISFTAAPDTGVSLAEVQTAFQDILSKIANNGIPRATYARVLDRFDSFWPDWSDEKETTRWMADYALARISTLRAPLSEPKVRRLRGALSPATNKVLLTQIAVAGRTAAAFIGPEDRFE